LWGLLITNHLDQSLWSTNQKWWVVVKSNLLHSFLEVHNYVAPFISHTKQVTRICAKNLISWFVVFDVIQIKQRSYRNYHPTNQFLPLTIEVFGCLHKHVDVFLYKCANAIWGLKRTKDFHLSTLITFLCQKVLITLQRMQAFSILSRAIAISLAISRLPPFQDTPPITMADLLQAVDFWHVNMIDLP